jgi:hypothetical protein
MQNELIYLLIFCIFLSLQGYYFGWMRPPVALAWLQKAAFVTSSFMLIPVLVFVLVTQSGAIKRLENTGIRPFPGIVASVGISTGSGEEPTWVFEVRAGHGEIHQFYSSPENTGNWSFQDNDGIFLRFRKDNLLLKIAHREGPASNTLIYMIEND